MTSISNDYICFFMSIVYYFCRIKKSGFEISSFERLIVQILHIWNEEKFTKHECNNEEVNSLYNKRSKIKESTHEERRLEYFERILKKRGIQKLFLDKKNRSKSKKTWYLTKSDSCKHLNNDIS